MGQDPQGVPPPPPAGVQPQAGEPDQVAPQGGPTTGLDGYTEDDVPMMQVGPPSYTHPDQVSTKPRQMPNGGQPAPGAFDPTAMGADVGLQRAEDNDTSTTDEDTTGDEMPGMEFESRWVPVLEEIYAHNPRLPARVAAQITTGVLAAWEDVDDGPWTRRIDTDRQGKPRKTKQPIHLIKTDPGKVRDEEGNWVPGPTPRVLFPGAEEKIRQWWERRRQGPGAPGEPEGQGEPREPDEPGSVEDREPQTLGEGARRQMAQDPSNRRLRRDMWKDRFSQRPIDSDEPDEPRPFGRVASGEAR